jgi:hypothetical protein
VEDANALILQCESDDSRKSWQIRMQGAIYRASVNHLFCPIYLNLFSMLNDLL